MTSAVVARLIAVTIAVSGSGAPQPSTLFRFADPRIPEASGIAAGRASPGVFYVQNDGGDTNRFFAVDRRSGRTAATITVSGARNVDWEDIAVGPDVTGTPSVWLADIGDNDAVRPTVQVYRVAEPHVDPASRGRALRLRVAQEWRLRYPGGPTDAEGFAVAPDGSAYIVSKSIGGATVYRLPSRPRDGRGQLLHRVGRIGFHVTGTRNPFGLAGQLTATGATISPDGSLFVVRTYADAWVWPLGTAGFGAALRGRPDVVRLPGQPQGEGIAVSGDRLVADSEGVHSAVLAVPLPAPSGSAGTPTVGPASPSTPPPTPTRPPGQPSSGSSDTPRLLILLGLLLGGFLVLRTAARVRRHD